jgi:hypothetical protein
MPGAQLPQPISQRRLHSKLAPVWVGVGYKQGQIRAEPTVTAWILERDWNDCQTKQDRRGWSVGHFRLITG